MMRKFRLPAVTLKKTLSAVFLIFLTGSCGRNSLSINVLATASRPTSNVERLSDASGREGVAAGGDMTAPDGDRPGSCWQRVDAFRRCHDRLAVNVTRAECCALNLESGSMTQATGWSPHVRLTPYQDFLYILVGNGAPDCQPCQSSCEGFRCGVDGKVCRLRRGLPQCVCPSDCSATAMPQDAADGVSTGPVCAQEDGRTYRSLCQLRRRGCRLNKQLHVDYNGPCQSSCAAVRCRQGDVCGQDQNGVPHCIPCKQTAASCGGRSPSAGDQVCGTDGRTYTDSCFMDRHSCQTGRYVSVAYAGNCRPGVVSCRDVQCGYGTRCLMDAASRSPLCLPCDQRCSDEIKGRRTLCATDGRTYSSYCEMLESACRRGVGLRAHHAGSCDDRMPSNSGPYFDSSVEYIDDYTNEFD